MNNKIAELLEEDEAIDHEVSESCYSPYSLIDYRSVSLDTFGDYAKNSEYINF